VFDSGLFGQLHENMTLYRKPEVHNILHCRQRRTEPLSQVTRTENVVKFVYVWFFRYASGQADKLTDRTTQKYAD